MSLSPVTIRNATDTFANEARPSENYSSTTMIRLDNTTGARKMGFLYWARPFPLGATVVSATLKIRAVAPTAWPAATRTITATRLATTWTVGRLTWNVRPKDATSGAALTGTATRSDAVTAGSSFDIDLTAMMQYVADGGTWAGVSLRISESTLRYFYSTQAARYKPTVEIVWSAAPHAPTTLNPSGGLAVSVLRPTLRFDFDDDLGNTTMQAAQVQIDDVSDFLTPLWDSGTVYTDTPQIDLEALGAYFPAGGSADSTADVAGFTGTNATLAYSTTQASTGTGSMRLTATAAGNMTAQNAAPDYTATPGQTYTVNASFRAAVTGRVCDVRLDWKDASGTVLSTVTSPTVTDNTTGWVTATASGVAPASTASVRVRVQITAPAAAEQHYVDNVRLVTGTKVYGFLATNDVTTYWRVRVQDGSGLWSDWSDPAAMERHGKGTLTITNPPVAGTVSEATPPIAWTFTGETQAAFQVFIEDATDGTILHNSGKVSSTATSYTLPKKIIHDGQTYTVRVKVWDTNDRAVTPGDPAAVIAERDFVYTLSATVAPVTSFTSTDLTPLPGVQLDFVRSTMPDSFALVRDGRVIDPSIDPTTVLVSGTSYRIIDRTGDPYTSHTWQVRAVVNGVTSTSNPTVTRTLKPYGIWLEDLELGIRVQLLGDDAGTWAMGEAAEIYTPLGSRTPIRVTQALRGYEGSITGMLVGGLAVSVPAAEDALLKMKGSPGRELQLTLADLSFGVVIGNVVVAPTPRAEIERVVSFDFWQVDDYTFTARL